jgi:hypothetical protein
MPVTATDALIVSPMVVIVHPVESIPSETPLSRTSTEVTAGSLPPAESFRTTTSTVIV